MAKPQKTELEAAADFVLAMCHHGQTQWPAICAGLQSFEPRFASFRDDVLISYEFTLASIAIHLHAIANLLPSAPASRIREHVLECLTTDQLGSYPRDAISEYDVAWNDYMERAEPPFNGVASLLFTKLGLTNGVAIDGNNFKNPVLLLAIGGTLVKSGGAFWKNYIERNEIVA